MIAPRTCAKFGGVTSWKQTTTPEIMLPASLALSAAKNATRSLEKALTEQGFEVIPHEQIAQTKAYEKHYKDYPRGYHIKEGMLGGFTIVGAHPMGVYQIDNIFQWGNLHQVWPDAQALKDIKDELGQDTLMLCLRFEAQAFQGGSSSLKCNSVLNVADPDYAGYGIGGYGHLVTAIDAHTDRLGTEVPGFLARDGKQWRVNWTPVFEDLERVHRAFAGGMASEIKRMAFPPTEGQ